MEECNVNTDDEYQIAIGKIREIAVDVLDLYQRYAHALDRIISLEKKVQSLSQKTKVET